VGRLSQQVTALGVQDRVVIEPAVRPELVVEAAAAADIGVIPWPLDLPQKRFALPNKLFEYLAAGLCVVQTGPSESAALVESVQAGRWYGPAEPTALAAALNSLTGEEVARHRAAARAAMTQITWAREREHLWALYRSEVSTS
jgi:glycosyltransferase involved in cell wall biosynthesis